MNKLILSHYHNEPLSIIRKTQVLINGIWVGLGFMVVVAVVHLIIPLGWWFTVGDFTFIGIYLILQLLIYKKHYELVTNILTVLIPLVVFLQIPLRDLMQDTIHPHTRFLETEVLLIGSMVFISLCAYNRWQIFWLALLSIVVILVHFQIIITKFHAGVPSSMAISDIVIYALLFILTSFISYYRYRISENLIMGLELESEKVKNLNNSLQAQVEERTQKIQEQNRQLQKSNFELDYLVYRVSHDVRGPIVSALGLIDLIRTEAKNPQALEYLEILCSLVLKLDVLVKDLIELSQNARLEVECELIDWQSLYEEALEKNHIYGNFDKLEKKITIEAFSDFYTDKQRLLVALTNLISNAIKYADTTKETPFLSIKIEANEYKSHIKVKDNGQGIESRHLEKVFDMFYRATDKSPGSGLGLYIVKEIVERLGGSVQVESKINKGSCFEIQLPNLFYPTELPEEHIPT